MSYNPEQAISIAINHVKLANVLSVHSTFHREKVITDNVLQKPATDMRVTIRRAKYVGDYSDDTVNLRTLENFRLDIYTPFHISTYTGCQWLDFSESIEADNKLVETITIASLNCTITT